MSLHLASTPFKTSARYLDATTIRMGERKVTYQTLRRQIERCAAALHSQGIGPGDHVALLLTG